MTKTLVIKKNAGWALVGQGAQLLIQMGYFVLIARMLTPDDYGAFVSVAALASAASAFCGMGSGHLLIREITRDPSRFRSSWGLALAFHFGFGSLLLVLLLCLSHWLLPPAVHLSLILAVGFADLLFARLQELGYQAFQAVHAGPKMSFLAFLSSTARLVGAVILALFVSKKSADSWGFLYLAASVVTGIVSVVMVSRSLGRPSRQFGPIRPRLRDGFHFATSRSAETIYNDIDKTMLARMSSLDATAVYSVAYRFVEAATIPIRALAAATYPVFFEKGTGGLTATYAFAKKILPKSVLYGAVSSVALFAAAPLLPYLMGSAYAQSAVALRWLALLPFLRSFHAFLLDTLTGADKQANRSAVQWIVAAFNVLINLWLIRAYSWKGASASSLLCDALLVLGLEFSILRLLRTRQPTPLIA